MNDDIWRYSDLIGSIGGSKYFDNEAYTIIKEFMNKEMENKYKEIEPEPTIEDKVVDIVKGGFEEKFGMTIQEFQEVYENIVENNPERLI